jgi:hypothetical protein
VIEEHNAQLQNCMYQYSRAIYRSIKDMIDPYSDSETQIESRRSVLEACEQTMERLAKDPLYFAKPDRALFQDIRRHFPITAQAQVAWAVQRGVGAAIDFIQEQIEAGALDGGIARCRATTRKGKPCQRTPLPERDYCPSHQHLERTKAAA